MAEERNLGLARATDAPGETDATKAELQRRMEEARESISQTVTEIKDTVVNQYQQVRESISDTLDWREQYRRHTLPLTIGAAGAGFIIGLDLSTQRGTGGQQAARAQSGAAPAAPARASGEGASSSTSGAGGAGGP